jgi:hypothetical protein
MPRVGFELTIPVFERAKTVHALDHAAHCDQHLLMLHLQYEHHGIYTLALNDLENHP